MGNQIFINNIGKTIKLINEKKLTFEIVDTRNTFSTVPRFDFTNKKIISPNSSHFSIFALRMVFRGILLGINYLIAADLSRNKSLWGPSILNYYTTCFHILHSYLALNGHVIIDPVYPVLSRDDENLNIQSILAIFSQKNSKWTFNKTSRDHKGRWFELKQIFIKEEDVPLCFNNLFNLWYGDLIKENIPSITKIIAKIEGKKIGTPLKVHDKIDDFLMRISETRHISLYQSFGSDPNVINSLQNMDTYTNAGIDRQVINFKKFTYEFYQLCLNELKIIINNIKFHKPTRQSLWILINLPNFDFPNIELLELKSLKHDLRFLIDWFSSTRQKVLH